MKKWYGITRWSPEDVITAAAINGVKLTWEQAAAWWEKIEASFENIMVEFGNEVLDDMDYRL